MALCSSSEPHIAVSDYPCCETCCPWYPARVFLKVVCAHHLDLLACTAQQSLASSLCNYQKDKASKESSCRHLFCSLNKPRSLRLSLWVPPHRALISTPAGSPSQHCVVSTGVSSGAPMVPHSWVICWVVQHRGVPKTPRNLELS